LGDVSFQTGLPAEPRQKYSVSALAAPVAAANAADAANARSVAFMVGPFLCIDLTPLVGAGAKHTRGL
jgi:hypothetical protein